jgi:hypothetical protein
MVESFISTQKYSLQRELQRGLRRFIVLPSDYYAVRGVRPFDRPFGRPPLDRPPFDRRLNSVLTPS